MLLSRASGVFLALLIGISACSTAPVGERSQIVGIPLAAVQSNIEFSLVSYPRLPGMPCADASGCDETSKALMERHAEPDVVHLAAPLQKAAMTLYPDHNWCVRKADGGCFDVYVVDSKTTESSSSANGRITLNSGLLAWQSDETVMAFVIAREMGHVIARHHQEQSSVSIVASVLLNVLIPGSGILKSLVSTGVGRIAAASNRDIQLAEADAIAINLLVATGHRKSDIARRLLAVQPQGNDDNRWVIEFRRSSAMLITQASLEDLALTSFSGDEPVDNGQLSVSLAQQPSSAPLPEKVGVIIRPDVDIRAIR